MGERGSFCTEFLYCDDCRVAVERELSKNSSISMMRWAAPIGGAIRIIAGRIRGSWPGNELCDFDIDMRRGIEEAICCPMRIAVHADSGRSRIFGYFPKGDEEEVFDSVDKHGELDIRRIP